MNRMHDFVVGAVLLAVPFTTAVSALEGEPEAGGASNESEAPAETPVDAPEEALADESAVEAEVSDEDALASLVEEATALTGEEVELPRKLDAVRRLGAVDDPRALQAVLDLASSIDAPLLRSATVRGPIVDAVARHVDDRAELGSFAVMVRAAKPEILETVVEGVVRSGSPHLRDFLVSFLGTSASLDAYLLTELDRHLRSTPELDQLTDTHLGEVRARLVVDERDVRRAAARVLGVLHDVSSIPDLAKLVDDPDPLVSGDARAALSLMAGGDVPGGVVGCAIWFEKEQDWKRDEMRDLVDALDSEDPKESMAALRELSLHPLWRHELAREIGPFARRTDVPIGGHACVVLTHLDTPAAIPYLLEALVVDDESRRNCAHEGLKSLTGYDLPPDYLPWAEALGF